ncbi:hypothetical protein ACFQZQ_11645 [Lysobacter koreensis]|uniref:Uncharacterized protein n=1 Tax=Lysobacter koreensis TaxID=266122 RepID=A0ABW2YNF1_9GAMM
MFYIAIPIMLALATAGPRPPRGVEVDDVRMVSALSQTPQDCLSYTRDGASILFEGRRISNAAQQTRKMWSSEAERTANLFAFRARQLVQAASRSPDRFGCRAVNASVDINALFVLLEEIEAGRAAVVSEDGQFQPKLAIHYVGSPCGNLCGIGTISVSLPDSGTSLLSLLWWQV